MALTDSENFHSAPGQPAAHAQAAITTALPDFTQSHAALTRLPALRDEAQVNLRAGAFVARSVPVAGLLLLIASVAALGGGGKLAPVFGWSLLTLLGIGAILRNSLRAQSSFNAADTASNLRAILFYMGFAWGAGAFLTLAPAPNLLLVAFAALPCLAVGLLLQDNPGFLAFAAPVTGLTLAASLLRDPDPRTAALLLILQAGLALFFRRRNARKTDIPAGLTLRPR